MKKLLVPIDFSPITKSVVTKATALARACHGRVTLIHVVEPPTTVIDYGLMNLNIPNLTAAGEKSAHRQLTQWKKRLQRRGIAITTVQATGFPVFEIIRQARKLGADCIVMGSHGHTAFYELLIGSTTSGVLKKAVCPVIIVPARKKGRAGKR